MMATNNIFSYNKMNTVILKVTLIILYIIMLYNRRDNNNKKKNIKSIFLTVFSSDEYFSINAMLGKVKY